MNGETWVNLQKQKQKQKQHLTTLNKLGKNDKLREMKKKITGSPDDKNWMASGKAPESWS